MAKLTKDELIEAFKEMTLIELSEFVKESRRSSTLRPLLRLLPLLLVPRLPAVPLRKRRPSSTSF